MVELDKWMATIRVALSNHMAYRLSFLLFFITAPAIFFVVKYNIWSSLYALDGAPLIAGYTLERMIAYQAWVMIVTFLSTNYNGVNLSEDIRLGKISSFLLYPFSFRRFHLANFICFQFLQFALAVFTVLILFGSGLLSLPGALPVSGAIAYCAVLSLLWYYIQFFIAALAFWLERTWILRVMLLMIGQLLSGAVIPLELFPDTLVSALEYSFFPYMSYVPVKLLMEDYNGSAGKALVILGIWILLMYSAGRLLWARGLRLYTAAGV